MTRRILVIGIGAGDPDFMTVQAVAALNRADVVFIPDKGAEKAALRHLRTAICDRFITGRQYRTVPFAVPDRDRRPADYGGTVAAWHAAIAARVGALLTEHLGEDGCGALLVWGDPTLFDSTLRVLDAVIAAGIALDYEVIPGISSVQALAAKHRITLNRVGEPVLLTTGRRLTDASLDAASAVVLLDGEQAFERIDATDVEIFWGAYLGTADEILVAGLLSEVGAEIAARRAAAREANGWIMDTYLLRRRAKVPPPLQAAGSRA